MSAQLLILIDLNRVGQVGLTFTLFFDLVLVFFNALDPAVDKLAYYCLVEDFW